MRVLRRLSSLGPVAVALGLLAALFFGTVSGVDVATTRAQKARVEDRALAVEGYARPLHEWLDAGRREAADLARSVARTGPRAPAPIAEYLAGPRQFGRSVVVVDRGLAVVATSPDRLALVGRVVPPCTRAGVEDKGLAELVSAATPDGALSRVFDGPGSCQPVVAAAAAAGASVVVVLGDLADADRGLLVPGELPVPDARLVLVDPAGISKQKDAAAQPVAPVAADFLQGLSLQGVRTGRYGVGDSSVVGAARALPGNWAVVLEQDAASFDEDPRTRPALTLAVGLTVVFAVVFGLVAVFEVHRRRAARRADNDRAAFLAIVGHELRTPLTVIKGYTETLAHRWDALDDRSRQMLIESMAPQARRQARVIEHLLTAASIQAGTARPPKLEPTDVRSLLEKVAADFRPISPLHDIRVEVGATTPPVLADARYLEQVVEELVDNAVRFAPSGGPIWLRAAPVKRGVAIAVEDQGVGLPSDTGRLFDPLVQAEDVDRRVHAEGGIGVGLSIVRALSEAMGGAVRAEALPSGARFVVSLRAARSRDVVPAGVISSSPAPRA